jgi:hypothetical protein
MQLRRMREQNLHRQLQIIAPTSPSSGSFSSCCGDCGSHLARLALGIVSHAVGTWIKSQ